MKKLIFTQHPTHMKQITVTRIMIISASVTLFVITYLGYRKIHQLMEVSNLVNETNSSRVELNRTYALLRAADSDLNNFLLTKDTVFYQNYLNTHETLGKSISRLYSQMRDQPLQCYRLHKMEMLIMERDNLMKANSEVSDLGKRKSVIEGTHALTRQIGETIKTIVESQQAMLEEREALKSEQESVIPLVFLGIAVFCVSLLLLSYLKITHELSLRVFAQNELELKNKALQHTNRELEHFAFGSSHDLQEPLRKIQTFCSMIERRHTGKLDPETLHLFGKIQSSAQHMRTLVNDLLGYAHFYYSAEKRESVDLTEVVNLVVQDFQSTIEEKSAQIRLGPLPVVHGVRGQLRRLFQNLISNALKYSKSQPSIRITSAIVEEDEARNAIGEAAVRGPFYRISVEDNGIGFESEFNDRIFLMFQRLHDKQQYEGSGIGLAICKKVAQNHGGYILAQGIKNHGSVFFVYLPVTSDDHATNEQAVSTSLHHEPHPVS